MSKLSKALKKVERKVSSVIPHQHSADRRAANQLAAEQIESYKMQKEFMASESKRIEEDRRQQRDKVNRKQISSARNAYRTPGFMEEQGYSDTLG